MAERERTAVELIGDFYQAHLSSNKEAKTACLVKIEELVRKNFINNKAVADYFNDVFSGRTGFNARMNISDYPRESIIRELFQNALGCRYESEEIKIVVDFKDSDIVSISYNEIGFSMEDILYYLSFGMNGGDESREGRFGIGAKSVFLNVKSLTLRSHTFGFKVQNDDKNLKITELNLNTKEFNGTKIDLELDHIEYERILDNFLNLTEKKGDYLNMVELCFAFNRKLLMFGRNAMSLGDNNTKSVNVAIAQKSRVTDIYRITLHQKDESDTPKIRFYHNNKSLLDFLYYDKEGFVYLIPFAVANTKKESVIKLLLSKYNYFSTYELTGYIGRNNDRFIEEKLSAFFVSVPNAYITYCRTGIRYDKEEMVLSALERDIPAILKEYGRYFILDLKQTDSPEFYFMSPRSYAFEFFNSFMKTSRYASRIKDAFVSGISLQFPEEDKPVSYEEIKKLGFKSVVTGVSSESAKDGSANNEFITLRLKNMKDSLKNASDKALYAGYNWENGDGSHSGRVYCYEFIRGDKTYKISSFQSGEHSDFELYSGFSGIIGHFLPLYLVNDSVTDETALEKILSLYDEAAGDGYTLSMKYYRLHFDKGEENYSFEISKIRVGNIKNAINTINKREKRFISDQNFKEVSMMLMNSFTQGKDVMSFLREIQQQGGQIELVLDFNKKYRFQAYGKQFMIPGSLTGPDLLEIAGDSVQLIESGVLLTRKFTFPYQNSVYSFDISDIAPLLSEYSTNAQTENILNSVFVCNLKFDGIALLDEAEKPVAIKRYNELISDEEREKTVRYVVLRDELNKSEYAGMLEYAIAGQDRGILNRFFSKTSRPYLIIPDRIPLSAKRAPQLDRDEFNFAIELYEKIKDQSELLNFKIYFAKDINSRLFGYGTYCACCHENGHNINAYDIVNFSADIMKDGAEKRFSFAIYLCKNHIADAGGWLIKELLIGGMSPFKWLEEITASKVIPPEFFICTMKYAPHVMYDISVKEQTKNFDAIEDEEKSMEFRITPLMAAKWIVDNR